MYKSLHFILNITTIYPNVVAEAVHIYIVIKLYLTYYQILVSFLLLFLYRVKGKMNKSDALLSNKSCLPMVAYSIKLFEVPALQKLNIFSFIEG